jgi:hypothetical protein
VRSSSLDVWNAVVSETNEEHHILILRHCTYIQNVCFNTSVNWHKFFYFLKKLGAQLIQQHIIQDNTIVFIKTNTGTLSCTFTGLYIFAGPVGLCHEKFLFFFSFFLQTHFKWCFQ